MGLHSTQSTLYTESVQKDPDTLAGYVSVPVSAANYYTNVYQLLGNGSGCMWFISANIPHVEAALRFLTAWPIPISCG